MEEVSNVEEEVVCQKCGDSTVPIPKFLASARLSDSTGHIYINFMNSDQGAALYGMTAMEILVAKLDDS